MSELELDGTMVTVFGASDLLGRALSDELGRRGCTTHHVPVSTGWLPSATHAVVRVDSRSGAKALRQLAERDNPRTHVVAVCAATEDSVDRERVRALCRACGASHDISLIWHEPLNGSVVAAGAERDAVTPRRELAAAIADEVTQHLDPFREPAFTSFDFQPGGPTH